MDIAISPTDEYWRIGKNDLKPYKTDAGIWSWVKQSDDVLKKIAIGPYSTWAVTTNNDVKMYDNSSWVSISGKAIDVGVGAEGSVYGITESETL